MHSGEAGRCGPDRALSGSRQALIPFGDCKHSFRSRFAQRLLALNSRSMRRRAA